MTNFTLYTKRLFDGENFYDNVRVTVANEKVVSIETNVSAQPSDKELSGLLVPGFIDLQVNGGGGALLNASPTLSSIRAILTAHARFGTSAMLPTLITDNVEVMQQAADAIAQAIENNEPGILGIHFEGPHLSVAKKGAHSAEFIRKISDEEWQVLSRKDIGQVLVTLAPETVPVADIKRMIELGIKVSLGHTNADFKTAQQAIDSGASCFTHLFNAMSPFSSREPGVVGAALLNDSAACGLIVDGHHVDYESCKLAIKAKPKGKLFLVTDAMPPVGTEDTEFDFFDRKVYLSDGKLTSTTGELAGSVLDMATAVRNSHHKLNLPLDEAIRMATSYPAQYLNLVGRGEIKQGSYADFVLLNDELEAQATWSQGKQLF